MMQKAGLLAVTSGLALAISSNAAAQTAPAGSAEVDELTAQDILVTGSRIPRVGVDAPTPVTAVQVEALVRAAPGTIADGLNQLPQFQNSVSGATRGTGTAGAQNSGNYLNLRSLGPNRVLVLQDGQRMPVSGNNGGVDVSLIPSMLIKRVEVVTGGASAVYGSDAVSGVVNFILDKELTGLKFIGQGGYNTDGNVPSYRLGVAGGISLLDDSLHIVASAERNYRSPLYRRWFPATAQGWGLTGAGSAASPFVAVSGIRATTLSAQGIVATGPMAGQFNSNGDLIPFNAGTPTTVAGINIGGDGGYFDQTVGTVGAGLASNQFFVRPEYDFGNGMKAFVSVSYNTSVAKADPGQGFIRAVTIFSNNAYLTPAQQARLGTTPSFNVGRIFFDGPTHAIHQTSKSTIINAGLEGSVTSTVKWSAGYTHAVTNFTSTQRDIEFQKFYASMDAVRAPNGSIVCNATLSADPVIAARYAGCVPFNPLGLGRGSQAGYDYFWSKSTWTARNKMDNFQASLTGTLLTLPAGPLSFAIGGEHRTVSLNQGSNADPRTPPNFTGLRGVISTQLTKFRLTNNGVASGSQKVSEFFGELKVPVLERSAIGSLSLNGAARLTDYSTSGQAKTWKLGAVFEPLDGVKFRGTVSRDIRAPSLFELFAAQQNASQSFFEFQDRAESRRLQLLTGGNPRAEAGNRQDDYCRHRAYTIGSAGPQHLAGLLSHQYRWRDCPALHGAADPRSLQRFGQCHGRYLQVRRSSDQRDQHGYQQFPALDPAGFGQPGATSSVKGLDFEMAYGFDAGGGRANVRPAGDQADHLQPVQCARSGGSPSGRDGRQRRNPAAQAARIGQRRLDRGRLHYWRAATHHRRFRPVARPGLCQKPYSESWLHRREPVLQDSGTVCRGGVVHGHQQPVRQEAAACANRQRVTGSWPSLLHQHI